MTIGLESKSSDRLSLAKLERHFERWKSRVADGKPWGGTRQYPSIFGYIYQPPFHGQLEAIDGLKETIVRVTGSAWAIPVDDRINLSFSLGYLLSWQLRRWICNGKLNIPPDETREERLRYAALHVQKLGEFDQALHSSENRGFYIADLNPWNGGGIYGAPNGSFVIYRFGEEPSMGYEIPWHYSGSKIS
jgi:hypothetical protein